MTVVGSGGGVVQHVYKPAVADENAEGRIAVARVQKADLRRARPHAADDTGQDDDPAAASAVTGPGLISAAGAGVNRAALAGVGQGDDGLHHAAAVGTGIDRAALAGVGQGNHGLASVHVAGVDRPALAGIRQGNDSFSRPAVPGGGRGELPHHILILIHICSRKHASGVLLSIGAMTVYAGPRLPVHDARMMEAGCKLYSKQASCQRT